MKVLISAAETSSDVHGAQLLRALKELHPTAEFFGLGGPRLSEAGLRIDVDAKRLLVMGFAEIVSRLPTLFSALGKLTSVAEKERPDVAVVIDYPDFHFLLAKRLKRLGIPVVYFISPKVWVWRKRRVRFIREHFAAVMSILPFEEQFFRDNHVNAKYVGNPLVDELPLHLPKKEARAKLGVGADEQVIALLPGSRPGELKRHVGLFLDALKKFSDLNKNKKIRFFMPVPLTVDFNALKSSVLQNRLDGLNIELLRGDSALALRAADAALIKSGTSTLEAALLECPHVITYKPNRLSCWIFDHIIRYRGPVGLSNLILPAKADGVLLFKELLCCNAKSEALADELQKIFQDGSARKAQLEGSVAIRSRFLND